MQGVRRQQIYNLLLEYESMRNAELARMLGVSEMTIHRDLEAMQAQGLLVKIRGGAVIADESRQRRSYVYNQMRNIHVREKRAIAAVAASRIEPGETVIFDNSTTAYEAARLLCDRAGISVIATNPSVFDLMMTGNVQSLSSTGGLYSPQTNSFVGAAAQDFISRQSITTAIVGTGGLSLSAGATDPFPAEAALKREIIRCAQRVLLLADHYKFGLESAEKTADIGAFDTIITDLWQPDDFVAALRKETHVAVAGRAENDAKETARG